MGAEPFLDAMYANPDFHVVAGGRAFDPAPFVAFMAYTFMGPARKPLSALNDRLLGAFFHIGKILECGGQCALPKSMAAKATIYKDGTFDVAPLDKGARCTALSVATHTLYEKPRPDFQLAPGGQLDLTGSSYDELEDGKSVRSTGARFQHVTVAGKPYTIKLEGAKLEGYRTMFVGAFKDPLLTCQVDDVFARIQQYVKMQHKQHDPSTFRLFFHKFGAYGKSAPGEVAVIGEAFGSTQALATSVANAARVACIHAPYPGQKATSGNMAFGICGKMEIEAGPCAKFCVYHLVNLEAGEEGSSNATVAATGSVITQNSRALFSWKQFDTGSHAIPPRSGHEALKPPVIQRKVEMNSSSKSQLPRNPRVLGDVAQIIRSKNAGPYEITFDLLFDDRRVYEMVRDSGLLTEQSLAALYGLNLNHIIFCGFFDPALAFKATIARLTDGEPSVSGGYGEEDVHGSQKYLPLMYLPLSSGLQEQLQTIAVHL
jgi:hypothetical protein